MTPARMSSSEGAKTCQPKYANHALEILASASAPNVPNYCLYFFNCLSYYLFV